MNSITVVLVLILAVVTIFSVMYTITYHNELKKARKKLRAIESNSNAALLKYRKAATRAAKIQERNREVVKEAEALYNFINQHNASLLHAYKTEEGFVMLVNKENEADYFAIRFEENKEAFEELFI